MSNFVRAVAAQADEAVKAEAVIGRDGPGGQIDRLTVRERHPVRFLAAGAENGAAGRHDPGDVLGVQDPRVVFHQSTKALLDADDLDVKVAQARLDDRANGGIQSRAVAATRQDADAPGCFGGCQRTLPLCAGLPSTIIGYELARGNGSQEKSIPLTSP